MAITFTSGLLPTFPPNSFDSVRDHVKLIYEEMIGGGIFENPLATALTGLTTQIDATNTILDDDIAVANAEAAVIQGYISGTLPVGWTTAPSPGPYDANDMAAVKVAIEAYVTRATACKTNNTVFKNFLIVDGVDNFRHHNDLQCGLREVPIDSLAERPTLESLMGVAMAITNIENTFGITPFTNYLLTLFDTLFTGDDTIAAAKAHMDTTPLPTTYDSLNIVTVVNANPLGTTPAAIEQLIGGITFTSYNAAVDSHEANFQAHITDDFATWNATLLKLQRYMRSYQISNHVQDPYYRFMYTDVFGNVAVNEIITQLINGDIT